MIADQIAALIPDEVVEAAAMILHANNEVLEDVPWDDLGDYDRDTYRAEARAAIAAALKAWPGMNEYTGYDGDKRTHTITLVSEVDDVRAD